MRGPGLKLDLDVRRLWTCPTCGMKRRLSGDIPSPLCFCKEGGVQMQLTADAPVFRRAERLTPLPFVKRPLPPGWAIPEPAEESAADLVPQPIPEPLPEPLSNFRSESASVSVADPLLEPPVSEPAMPETVAEEFGANLDLPPDTDAADGLVN